MKITTFAKKIAQAEGLKKQVDIAQISEILRVVNVFTGGVLYAVIRLMR